MAWNNDATTKQYSLRTIVIPFSSDSTIKAKTLAAAFITSGGNNAFPLALSVG